ncbi:hypothetical protein [Terrarubrum flagellatum]|uniref:hypothetical protein n=1 Tax=Terrirubrum flagellatum TaxID=2895980 RepID=UPI003144E883
MKSVLLAIFALMFAPALASAKSYTLPESNAVAVITIPDTWDTDKTTDGVESTSADEEIDLSIEVKAIDNVVKATEEALKYLIDNGMKIDPATEKRREFKINGMDGLDLAYSGTYEGEANNVSVSIIIVDPKNVLIMTYWATAAGEEKNLEDLKSIALSIKRVGG